MRDQDFVSRPEHRRFRRFKNGPHTLVPDTIERGIEPLVDVIGVHPVIHADRGNLRLDQDTTGLDSRIGSVNKLDLAGFRNGQDFVAFGFGHEISPFRDLALLLISHLSVGSS
jgi:hypothetical protein